MYFYAMALSVLKTKGRRINRSSWLATKALACLLSSLKVMACPPEALLRSPLLNDPPPASFLLRYAVPPGEPLNGAPDFSPLPSTQNESELPISRLVVSSLKARTGYDGINAVSSEDRETLFTEQEGGPRLGLSTTQLAKLKGEKRESSWDLTVRSALPSAQSREITEREYTVRFHHITFGVVTDAVQEMNTYRIRIEWHW